MGSYNFDFVEFANFNQIKVYSDPVGDLSGLNSYREFQEKMKALNENDECPFSHEGNISLTSDSYVPGLPELTEFEKLERKKHSLESSVSRTKNIIYEYAQNNKWEWFITLTFKRDNNLNVYDFDSVMKSIRRWLNNINTRYYENENEKLKYLLIPEKHKDGAWHFHGFLANTQKLTFLDSGKKYNGRISYNLKEYKKGFSVCERVSDSGKISSYVLKYVTKDLIDQTSGKTRFIVSRGLERAIHNKKLLSETEMQKLGVEIMRMFEAGKIIYKKVVDIPNSGKKIVTYFVEK